MQFDTPVIPGTLLRRYQRFLADIELDDGRVVTAHSSNTGSMLGVSEAGSRVWLSDSGNPKRKYPLTWELVQTKRNIMVGINTLYANRLVREAVENGIVGELVGYGRIRQEVPYGEQHSRIDLLLENEAGKQCYVEVKNVTLLEQGVAMFPDAVSLRGQKHLQELAATAARGHDAVIFFCIQREDASVFRPAAHIDPAYAELLHEVSRAGVQALAYKAKVDVDGISLVERVPVEI